MKRDELILLRNLVTLEQDRRNRINELLNSDEVMEYLKLSNTDPITIDPNDLREIIEMIIKTLEFHKSNGIYVCTNAYDVRCSINYEETDYYTSPVPINSDAEYKIYGDIETGKFIKARNENKEDRWVVNTTNEFENNNIVLNPTNSSVNMNKYNEVRLVFFENAINLGQAKSKKLILEKYKRL